MAEEARRKILHRGASSKVLEYMLTTDGREVSIDRISADTGLPAETVYGALSYLSATDRGGVERVRRGWYRRVRLATAGPGGIGSMFEQIGVTEDGSVLVRSEDGVVYKLGDPL